MGLHVSLGEDSLHLHLRAYVLRLEGLGSQGFDPQVRNPGIRKDSSPSLLSSSFLLLWITLCQIKA